MMILNFMYLLSADSGQYGVWLSQVQAVAAWTGPASIEVSREFLSSVRVVKAFCAQGAGRGKFRSAAEDFAGAGVSAMRVAAVFRR